MKIGVFGTGYVGLVTGASLAGLGHSVICVDIDQAKVDGLQRGIMPFYEPGLHELVTSQTRHGRLSFTTNHISAIDRCPVLFNCVGTPGLPDGTADLQYVWTVVQGIATHALEPKLIINKSTVPPGTARQCQKLLDHHSGTAHHRIVSNPEFLKQGNAVYDFNHPDRIVIGSPNKEAIAQVHQIYHGLQKTYIPAIETDWETSELIKYANNSFLATKISFINEIANIADLLGADIKTVAQAIGLDYRIGSKFLNAGVGYGGSCFPKDVQAIISYAKNRGYNPAILQVIDSFNERQKKILLPLLYQELAHRNISDPRIAIFGLSFKPKTSDLRGAPSLSIIDELIKKYSESSISAYDPSAMDGIKALYPALHTCQTPYEAAAGSDAIMVLTEWDEFRNLDFQALGKVVRTKVIMDGRNIYEPSVIKQAGFTYYGVGRR